MEARAIADDNPFRRATHTFHALTAKLGTGEILAMDHAEVENLLQQRGRELVRQLFQDHVDLRGDGVAMGPVVGDDDVERTHRRKRSRPLRTLFGPLTITRSCYGARRYDSLSPLDTQLNLPKGTYSLGVRRRVALEAAKVSFDEVVASLEETTGASVAKRQTEELARLAAVDFDDFYQQREPAANTPTGEVLVLTTDGKGIVMREQDLREATRKAAQKFKPKLKKRRSKGEKAGRKRMAQVVAVYTIDRFQRTADDIVGELGTTQEEGKPKNKKTRPRPEHKRVWASIIHNADDVIVGAFDEAHGRDPDRDKDWVMLVDGNEAQLNTVLDTSPLYNTKVTVIVDVIHVLEYLWSAARAVHGEGSPVAEEWVTKRLRYLLEGIEPTTVAAGVRRSATKHGVTGVRRKAVETCARYLCKYADYLHYADYIAAGYPIGTGVVEGACRHLVKDRMDITGARWSLCGAESVLRLRALRASGDFDEYWAFHERRELERNHLSRYAGSQPPSVLNPMKTERRALLRVVS